MLENICVVYTKMRTFTTFFRKKAEPFRIHFNLGIVGICKELAGDLHTVKNKNHTCISRIRDADKEGVFVTPGRHFHKKELVDLQSLPCLPICGLP
jgi:hypothetical protein